MADVGDVSDVSHLVAQMTEQFLEHVIGHSRPGMAQMRVAIYRRSADIHSHVSFVDGLEEFLLSGEGVGQIYISHCRLFLVVRI